MDRAGLPRRPQFRPCPLSGGADLNRTYFPALDGLRALAIALVVFHHISFRAFPGGHAGVDLFFVLSGFLITSVMLREYNTAAKINFGAFYIRRTLRLAPALLLMMVLVGIGLLIVPGPGSHELISFVAAATYTMDFVRAFGHVSDLSVYGATWSLAIEEQFYLIWPTLAVILLRRQPRLQLGVLFGLIVLVNILRIALYTHGASQARVYFCIDTRADQLLMGCALALWLNARPDARLLRLVRGLWPFAVAALTAVVFLDVFNRYAPWFEFSIVAVLAAIIILELTQSSDGVLTKVFAAAPVVYIGRISYGIYLWHYPIFLVARHMTSAKLAIIPAAIASVALAALSYQFFELPILRLKQRFEPKGVKAVPGEEPRGLATSGAEAP